MQKSFLLFTAFVMFMTVCSKAQIAIGVQGEIAIPVGSFGDAVDMDYGGVGTFLYSVTPKLQLTGSVGYQKFSGETNISPSLSGLPAGAVAALTINEKCDYSIIPIMVGGRYLIGEGNIKPYIKAEAGLAMTSFDYYAISSVKMTYLGSTATASSDSSFSESFSNFVLNLGGGVLFSLNQSISIDLNVNYNAIMLDMNKLDKIKKLASDFNEIDAKGSTVQSLSKVSSLSCLVINAGVQFAL